MEGKINQGNLVMMAESFRVDVEPPGLLMEGDKEDEWLIARPIIEDVISEAVNEAKMRQLQRIVDDQMKEVSAETQAQRLKDYFESILCECADEAVARSLACSGKFSTLFFFQRLLISCILVHFSSSKNTSE